MSMQQLTNWIPFIRKSSGPNPPYEFTQAPRSLSYDTASIPSNDLPQSS